MVKDLENGGLNISEKIETNSQKISRMKRFEANWKTKQEILRGDPENISENPGKNSPKNSKSKNSES